MSQTIHISGKNAELLAQQAAAHGISVEAWIEELAAEKAHITAHVQQGKGGSTGRCVVDQMRELRSQIKLDPQGWTVKDYVNFGRR